MTQPRTLARLEDLTFLADTGTGFTEAAHRLGITPRALERWLTRNHLQVLSARLRDIDPPDPRRPGYRPWNRANYRERQAA